MIISDGRPSRRRYKRVQELDLAKVRRDGCVQALYVGPSLLRARNFSRGSKISGTVIPYRGTVWLYYACVRSTVREPYDEDLPLHRLAIIQPERSHVDSHSSILISLTSTPGRLFSLLSCPLLSDTALGVKLV